MHSSRIIPHSKRLGWSKLRVSDDTTHREGEDGISFAQQSTNPPTCPEDMPPQGRITRTRPSTTCGRCRQRKVRCDRQKPACSQCGKVNVQCSYEPDPSSQGASTRRREQSLIRKTIVASEGQEHWWDSSRPDEQSLMPSLSPISLLPLENHTTAWQPGLELDLPYLSATNDLDNFQVEDSLLFFDPEAGVRADSLPVAYAEGSSISAVLKSSCEPGPTPPAVQPSVREKHGEIAADTSKCDNTHQRLPLRQLSGPFWALAGNRQSEQRRVQSTFDETRWSKLCGLLEKLPPRSACDELLQSFLYAVRPIVCIVHVPTLMRDYEAFWGRDHRNWHVPQPQQAMEEAAFFCLLWAVLFCGAAAKTCFQDSSEASLSGSVSSVSAAWFKSMFKETYSISRQSDLPTLEGLAASLLVHECDVEVDELLDTRALVSQSFLAARALGLHREEVIMSRGKVEAEICRRLWYHVLYLEGFAAVSAGNSTSSNGDFYDTRIPLDISDAEIETARTELQAKTENTASSSMLNVSRFEAFSLFRVIMKRCYGPQPPTKKDLRDIAARIRSLCDILDVRATRLRVRGLPEDGQISSQLLVPRDPRQDLVHNDSPLEETIFNAYARICLSLIKDYVAMQFSLCFAGTKHPHDNELTEIFESFALIQHYSGITRCEPGRLLCQIDERHIDLPEERMHTVMTAEKLLACAGTRNRSYEKSTAFFHGHQSQGRETV
ncbi:hypothetical protein M406DRAFT_67712 [Cryphonectria parasitica EP155]|uniref:Zn(2)-C6 fungal-type domain-containing protein n=1 Tax=Cryphonectria parasitica (strain ATCC 38755 / EP155) TaxID=660469 RepID=A0A9P5CUK9_CRYP1|nr:uncharacterized protein M406DRAFT_67712 [Cryphonectria parasitica EP155]KAF3771408.1 hypothetical protein M406DRAFT_67712 [Cryphonectria parasitica EP155]